VDDFNYRAKRVNQLVVLFPVVFEGPLSFQQELEDVLERMAVLEFICGGMFDKVYSGLVGIAVECGIEDGLKSCGCGRRGCWRHQRCMNVRGKEPDGRIFVRYTRIIGFAFRVPTMYSFFTGVWILGMGEIYAQGNL